MTDYVVILQTSLGFAVERHHDKPEGWDGDKGAHEGRGSDGGMKPGRVLSCIALDTPEKAARTLDAWRALIIDNTPRSKPRV